ncbi:MAG: PIN domain-containing protein [Crocosphaera sp.]|nr:PIN domain-containing protein [Crocosphaera sp.]
MKQIFADTFYWVALINKKDNWHQRVIEVTSTLKNVEIVTTDEVLIEVLNFLSATVPLRRRTVQFVDDIMQNPHIKVIPQNRESFLEGFNLYRRRLDKEYSLTDCISMTVMQRLKINEVLTHDNHFKQEGFIILF